MMRNTALLVLILVSSCSHSTGSSSAEVREGGFAILRNKEHGLAVTTVDVGYGTWEEARAACDALIMEGYDDWRLPRREELSAVYRELYQKGIGELKDDTYWSADEQDEHHRWARDFGNGRWKADAITLEQNAFRAVRDY